MSKPNPNARPVVEPVVEGRYETHPAFGHIYVNRVSSNPGAVLFDSDIKHQHYMTLRLSTAERKRDLSQDWINPRERLFEVAMSEAQWASFVSSVGSSGVPCTIVSTPDQHRVPGLPFAPRTAESMAEVRGAADKAYGKIKAALTQYENTPSVPKKAKDAALSNLHLAIHHATADVAFVGKSLVEHTENVVQCARADIEAMVVQHAQQIGIDPANVTAPLILESGNDANLAERTQHTPWRVDSRLVDRDGLVLPDVNTVRVDFPDSIV
jgi:hypothetical protein